MFVSTAHNLRPDLERNSRKQAHGQHAERQQNGAQEALALPLRFHHQQFEAVFTDGQ